jgi:hypothetical protein
MARPKPKQKPIEQQQTPSMSAIDTDYEEAPSTGRDIVKAKGLTPESKTMVVQMHESELTTRLAHAERHPRNIPRCMENMWAMATMSDEAAASMTYDVPRGGKIISDASIRFAEIAQVAWRNSHSDAYVIEINRHEMYVAVKGVCIDLETNVSFEEFVSKPIRDQSGKIYTHDMINMTCRMACAIAKREAILACVPPAAWKPAWKAARAKAVEAEKREGLPKRRSDALKRFMEAGVMPDRVLLTLGVRSEAQMTSEHITTLVGMWSAFDNGEATMEELFPPIKAVVPADEGAPKPKPKTLADLGEENGDTAAEDDREKLLEQAADDGRDCFHKGVQTMPERWRHDPGLAKAWQDEYDAAHEVEQEQEEEGDGDEGRADQA